MKENKLEYLVWSIFAIVGLIFLIIGLVICINNFNYNNKVETKGTITEIYHSGKSKEVYVAYNVNGEEIESTLHAYSSSFYVGKEIDIYYDIDNPSKIGVKSLDLLYLLFPGIGILFTIIGGTGILVKLNGKRKIKLLKENGTRIYADYIETTCNTGYKLNGRHPYNVICEWNNPEDGKKYIFKSKNIWINIEEIIKEKGTKKLPVYTDLENMKKYYVDLDEITKDIVDLR